MRDSVDHNLQSVQLFYDEEEKSALKDVVMGYISCPF